LLLVVPFLAMGKASLIVLVAGVWLLPSCSPPREVTPALTPENAQALLNANDRAITWIKYAQKQDYSCQWHVELPDQSAHPTEIDVDHIVHCQITKSPRELDASVQFIFDKDQKRWVISAFRS
jgi:hypothetical protein